MIRTAALMLADITDASVVAGSLCLMLTGVASVPRESCHGSDIIEDIRFLIVEVKLCVFPPLAGLEST